MMFVEDEHMIASRTMRARTNPWSGRRGSNPQLPAWESKFSILYFQYLQNRSEKMYVHALHTVHVVPDLRVAGGRLGDGVAFDSDSLPVLSFERFAIHAISLKSMRL